MSWMCSRSRYRRWPQCSQYQENPSSSAAPRRRSTTMPTVPGAALRRVRDLRGQEKHLAFADRHVDSALSLDGLQHDVALELIEELGTGVMVEILAGIGAADRHHDELAILEQQLVAHGRLEKCAVLIDPGAQVEAATGACDLTPRSISSARHPTCTGAALGGSSRSAVRLPPQTQPVSSPTTSSFWKNPRVDQWPKTMRVPRQRAPGASNQGMSEAVCGFARASPWRAAPACPCSST